MVANATRSENNYIRPIQGVANKAVTRLEYALYNKSALIERSTNILKKPQLMFQGGLPPNGG